MAYTISPEIIVFIVLGFVVLCGVAALITFLCLNRPDSPRTIKRRFAEDQAFIKNGFFQATSDILREAARHQPYNQRHHC
ncbi:MAG: hypothetical protein LBS19_05875 [Clostridiales bacterium]|jgi:hypothetical protein|nr:hypothetical protein [Clostridiales bacterium]